MDGFAAMMDALEEVDGTIKGEPLDAMILNIYNRIRDSKWKEEPAVKQDLLPRILKLSISHRRELCKIALKESSMPELELLFAGSLLDADEEIGEESEGEEKDVAIAHKYHYHQELMSCAIQSSFSQGVKYLYERGVQLNPEIVNGWCKFKEGANKGKSIQMTYNPNKYHQLENITIDFVLNGDSEMLKAIVGKDDTEKTKNSQYIKNISAALPKCLEGEEMEDEKRLECIKILVCGGVDVNKPGSLRINHFETSPTPLMMAAIKGKQAVVEYLIQNGADVNCHDKFGENILHYLTKSEYDLTPCLDTIFAADYNYKINIKRSVRMTYLPLHLAIQKEKFTMARKLIDLGANVNYLDLTGKNILHYILSTSENEASLNLAKYVIDREIVLNIQDQVGDTPLDIAIASKATSYVQLLLENDCEVDTLCKYKLNSPLWKACDVFVDGNKEILNLMLKSKCDVNLANMHGVTALMKAAGYPCKELVKLLIQHGADLNVTDNQGRYASSYCFQKTGVDNRNTCYETLQCFFDAGAEVKIHNKENQLLHMALIGKEYETFDLLLNMIDDYNEATKAGESVLHLLARTKHIHLAKYEHLFENGTLNKKTSKQNNTPLMMASCLFNKNYLQIFCKHNGDFNTKNKKGRSALHFCIIGYANFIDNNTTILDIEQRATFLECVDILIAGGADVDLQDNSGKTPLMFAMTLMDAQLIDKLLKAGADPEIFEDVNSMSAMHYLDPEKSVVYYIKCLEQLVSNGYKFPLDFMEVDENTFLQDQLKFPPDTDTEVPELSYLNNLYNLLAANYCLKYPEISENEWSNCFFRNVTEEAISSMERDNLRKLFFLSGSEEDAIILSIFVDVKIEGDDYTSKFGSFCNNISLQSRCRRVIRRCLGTFILPKIQELSIPSNLRNFLLLNNLWRVEEVSIPAQYFSTSVDLYPSLDLDYTCGKFDFCHWNKYFYIDV